MSGIPVPLQYQATLFFSSFSIFFTTFLFLSFFPAGISSADTITSSQSLAAGQSIVSSNDVFQLGFFTPDNNTSWYVGIWYKNIPGPTYVWVANRDSPLKNSSSAVLRIGDGGNLVIEDGQVSNSGGSIVWSSNLTAVANPTNLVAQLLDTGNLVVREASDEQNYLWQSFNFPTNTLLPDMKLGSDLKSGEAQAPPTRIGYFLYHSFAAFSRFGGSRRFSCYLTSLQSYDSTAALLGLKWFLVVASLVFSGLNRYIASWKSINDPSAGEYSFKLDIHGFPEAFLEDKRRGTIYRSGPWNGVQFSGVPEMVSTKNMNFTFVSSQDEIYYSYHVNNPGLISRLIVNASGSLQRLTWVPDSMSWSLFWYILTSFCSSLSFLFRWGISTLEN